MITSIHIYSETRINGEWKADASRSFEASEPNKFGWVNAVMTPVRCSEDYRLFGLLVDDVRHSWPWSMHARGFPDDASFEVGALNRSWGVDGYGHSYLSLQDLVEMVSTLLLDPRPDATMLLQHLVPMIRAISETYDATIDPEDRRVVFWFDS